MTEKSYYQKPVKDPKKALDGGTYLERFNERPPMLYKSIQDITGESDSYVGGTWIGRRMYPPNQ